MRQPIVNRAAIADSASTSGLITPRAGSRTICQEFLRFVALNRTAVPLDRAIRRELYREGVDGMVKILREASTELI